MISMAIRSCGVWTNGTTSRVCSGMASRFWLIVHYFFFFNDTAPTEIYTAQYTLSLHDALPIFRGHDYLTLVCDLTTGTVEYLAEEDRKSTRLTPVTLSHLVCRLLLEKKKK